MSGTVLTTLNILDYLAFRNLGGYVLLSMLRNLGKPKLMNL